MNIHNYYGTVNNYYAPNESNSFNASNNNIMDTKDDTFSHLKTAQGTRQGGSKKSSTGTRRPEPLQQGWKLAAVSNDRNSSANPEEIEMPSLPSSSGVESSANYKNPHTYPPHQNTTNEPSMAPDKLGFFGRIKKALTKLFK